MREDEPRASIYFLDLFPRLTYSRKRKLKRLKQVFDELMKTTVLRESLHNLTSGMGNSIEMLHKTK